MAQDALHKAQFPELHTSEWKEARRSEQIEEVNFRLGWIVPAIAQRRVLDPAWYAGFVQAVVERRDPPLYGQYLRSINEVPDAKEEKLAFWNTTAPLEALGRVAQMLETPKQEVGRLLYQIEQFGGGQALARQYCRLFMTSDEAADKLFSYLMQ